MKRLCEYLMIAMFAALLAVPSLTAPFFSDKFDSAAENRNRASFPKEFRWKRLPKELEDFYNDRVPFRNPMLDAACRISMWFYPEIFPNVIIGKDGFLFYRIPGSRHDPLFQRFGRLRPSRGSVRRFLRYFSTVRRDAASRHADFLLVIPPNKINVYPDKLPLRMHCRKSRDEYPDLVCSAGTESVPELRMLYLEPWLLECRKHIVPDLYFSRDTHWNFAGAYCGMRAIVAALGAAWPSDWPDPWHCSWRRLKMAAPHDLVHMLPRRGRPSNAAGEVLFPDGLPSGRIVRTKINGENYFITEKEDAPDRRTVLIFRDSFTIALEPFLSAYFRKVHFMQSRYRPAIVESVKPDLVICEIIARDLCSYERKRMK